MRAVLNPPDVQTQEHAFAQRLGCLRLLSIRHRLGRKCFPWIPPEPILSPTAAEYQWYARGGTSLGSQGGPTLLPPSGAAAARPRGAVNAPRLEA